LHFDGRSPILGPVTGEAIGVGCCVCGRAPAVPIDITRVTGMLYVARRWKIEGPHCRDCGLAQVHDVLGHNLAAGWWGYLSLFFTLGSFVGLRRARGRLRALAPPYGQPLAPPLPPAKRLWRRPGPYIAGAWVLVVLIVIPALVLAPDPVGAGRIGQCAVVAGSGQEVDEVVDCDDPVTPHDGRVVGVGHDLGDCPAGSEGAIPEDDGDDILLCVDLDA
jgi:hypothetical protein